MDDPSLQLRARQTLGQVIYSEAGRTLTAGDLVAALLGAGVRVYTVGGAPREWLSGCDARDLDLYVDRDLGEVQNLLQEAFPGVNALRRPREQGILLCWSDGVHAAVDISILRSYRDIQGGDAWTTRFLPRSDLREDALLRDFSINVFYYDFASETLLDPLGCGLGDLRTRTLQVITHPDVVAAHFLLTLRISLFSCRGYTPGESALEHLARHADRDVLGMGPRLWNWIPKNVVHKGTDLGEFERRLRPWLHREESHRLLDQVLADVKPG